MPGRGTDGGGPRREVGSWDPIHLLRVDVDARVVEGDAIAAPGARVWVEAIRGGQVVGLVEARLDAGCLTQRVLDDVSSQVREGGDDHDDPAVPDAELGFATVVVPTLWRRPDQLARTVESLDALDYPDFEVVVVDNRPGGSTNAPSFPGRPRVRIVAGPVA